MAQQKVKRTPEEWMEIIRECKASGISDQRWCDEHGVCRGSFYRNLKKFRENDMRGEMAVLPTKAPSVEKHEVVPLTVMGNDCYDAFDAGSPAARIVLNGMTIELYNNAGTGMVKNILQAAGSIC